MYTLLFHFCCVKFPETKFHEICRKLPNLSQRNIAILFKELQHNEKFNREFLRQIINELIELRPLQTETTTENVLTTSNGSVTSIGNNSSINLNGNQNYHSSRLDSPSKISNHQNGNQRSSPVTPKSNLLEERTRELFHLRVSL